MTNDRYYKQAPSDIISVIPINTQVKSKELILILVCIELTFGLICDAAKMKFDLVFPFFVQYRSDAAIQKEVTCAL